VVYTNEQGGNIVIKDPNAPINRQKSAVLDDDGTNRIVDQTLAEYSEPQNAPRPGIVEEPSGDEGESLLDKTLGAAGDAATYLPRKGRELAEQGGNLVLREAFGANKPRGSLSQNEITLGRDADQMMANRLNRAKESLAEHGGYGAGITTEKGIEYFEGKAVQKTLDAAGEAANAAKKARGARNPKVAEALRKGQKAHAERVYPEGFKKEVELPSGRRMDAYNKETKEVRELKPDNSRAVRKGDKQLDGYCKECDEVYGPGHTGAVETYDPVKIK
jgi:hypothetical protein